MENTYKFDFIQSFTSDIKWGEKSEQLIEKIEFAIIGYSGEYNTFIIDSVEIPYSSNELIPYNELNKEILIKWVIEFLGEKKINNLKLKIDEKLKEIVLHFAQFDDVSIDNLPKATLPPWASQEVPEWAVKIIPKIDTGQ
jgi:hypothetical protein